MLPAPLTLPPGRRTYRQIGYRESGAVGYLEFSFPGGAMSTGQCQSLLAAYRHAQGRPVKVIVLGPPRDFFGNGIHLNVIQAAAHPGAESWRNINAIDDVVRAILTNTGQLTVAALAGNAAAGGLMLALAADQVWCRSGAVLNPHYRLMGLHGSEYWTYTLPRRVGAREAARLTEACLPVTPGAALRSGLVDHVIGGDVTGFRAEVAAMAEDLVRSPGYPSLLATKARRSRRPGSTARWPTTAPPNWPSCPVTSSTRTSPTPNSAGPSSTRKSPRTPRPTWPGTAPIHHRGASFPGSPPSWLMAGTSLSSDLPSAARCPICRPDVTGLFTM